VSEGVAPIGESRPTGRTGPEPKSGAGRRPAPWAAVAAVAAVGLAGLLAAIAVSSPLVAVGIVGAVLLVMTILVRPGVATLVVVAVLYSNAGVIAVRFHDVPNFVAAAVPMLLIPPLAAFIVLERRPIVVTSALPWIVVFLLVQLVSGILSVDAATAFDTVVTFLVEGIGLYFLVTNVVRSRDVVIAIVWILLAIGAALGALSFYQDATGTYDNVYLGFAQPSEATVSQDDTTLGTTAQYRLAGNIGEKNRYAQIMLMLVPLGLFMAIGERSRIRRALALGAAGVTSLGVALTFSRGAAVGFVLLFGIMLLMGYLKWKHMLAVVLGAAIVLAAVPVYTERLAELVAVSESVGDTGIDQADGAIQSRVTEGLAALLAWADHPVLGVGPGEFPQYYRQYADVVGIRVKAVDREAHNLYLGMAAELGLIGLTVFLIIVGLTLRDLARARRAVRPHDSLMADITTGFMLSIVAYLATGIFLHMSFIRYFWLMLALAAASGLVSMAIARAHADDAGKAKPVAEPDGPSAPEPRTERRADPWGPDPRMDPFAT
jgi:putative inorganic carbon (hco3(-)) transporter